MISLSLYLSWDRSGNALLQSSRGQTGTGRPGYVRLTTAEGCFSRYLMSHCHAPLGFPAFPGAKLMCVSNGTAPVSLGNLYERVYAEVINAICNRQSQSLMVRRELARTACWNLQMHFASRSMSRDSIDCWSWLKRSRRRDYAYSRCWNGLAVTFK